MQNLFAKALQKWRGDKSINITATKLSAHWNTTRDWLSGAILPRDRDLPAIALATDIPLEDLARMVAFDRNERRVGVRIDTIEQTQRVVHALQHNAKADA